MKAIGFFHNGPIDRDDALVELNLPDPVPGPRDLLVEVRAISVNPVDTKVRRNATPPDGEARLLGYDASGVVRAVGSEVSLFKPGDEVWYAGAIGRPGTNAELHAVDERIVGRKPSSLSFADAAALPLTAITAWELLFDRLQVVQGGGQGDAILVTGAAGGVGSILVQLARQLTGLTVIGTASRPETQAWVTSLGAHHVIDHTQTLQSQLDAIGIPQVRYVASLTHSDAHYDALVQALAPQGKLGLIDDPGALDIMKLKGKALSLHWEMMFARPMHQTPDMIEQHKLLNAVADLVDAGRIRATVGEHFGRIDAANLKRAHALIESNRAKGKIVLEGF